MPLLILDKLLLSILPNDLSARAGWLRQDNRLRTQADKRQCAQAGQKAVCSLPPKGAGDMKAIFILVPPGDYYVTGFHNQFPDDLF